MDSGDTRDRPLAAFGADEISQREVDGSSAQATIQLPNSHGKCKYKAILIGEQHTGKSSLFRLISGRKVDQTVPEVPGIDYASVKRTVNNAEVEILYFDTAGMESHRYSLSNQYYRRTDIMIFCYSAVDDSSIAALLKWNEDVRLQCTRHYSSFLVGTKSDIALKKSEECVPLETAEDFSDKLGCVGSFRVSAATGEGVEQMLQVIAEHVQKVSTPSPVKAVRPPRAVENDPPACFC